MKQKALVKLYNWKDLTTLVMQDLHKQYGLPVNPDDEFHYIGGTDTRGNPCIRIDLTPIPGVKKFQP
jgi:hypothetical protein